MTPRALRHLGGFKEDGTSEDGTSGKTRPLGYRFEDGTSGVSFFRGNDTPEVGTYY